MNSRNQFLRSYVRRTDKMRVLQNEQNRTEVLLLDQQTRSRSGSLKHN